MADRLTALTATLAGHGDFAGPDPARPVTVTDVSVGPLVSASLDVARADGPGPGEHLLGMDVIGRYRCHFRFAAGVVDVGPSEGGNARGADLTANATLERPMDLILGYPTWSQADWLFDFPARTWALT